MNDHCEEIIPDGGDHNDIPEEIWVAVESLNKAIKKAALYRGQARSS